MRRAGQRRRWEAGSDPDELAVGGARRRRRGLSERGAQVVSASIGTLTETTLQQMALLVFETAATRTRIVASGFATHRI